MTVARSRVPSAYRTHDQVLPCATVGSLPAPDAFAALEFPMMEEMT